MMRRHPFVTNVLVPAVVLCSISTFLSLNSAALAADDPSVLQADREFVQAAGRGDTATVGRVLDADFTWTDADGKTRSRAEVLDSLPTPALGNESGAQVKQHTYSQV